jgi:hypothetical protein
MPDTVDAMQIVVMLYYLGSNDMKTESEYIQYSVFHICLIESTNEGSS